MKTLKSFSLKLFAILMLFTFIACSGDDDSVPQPSVPQPSPADNKIITELKKYKWTYNGSDPEINTMYFINDNMGVTKCYNKSPSMGTIEESFTFTYKIDKNHIIIKHDKGGTSDYLWIGDGSFIGTGYYNVVYKRSEYTSEDYKYVKEIQKKKEKRDVIKKNFSVKVTKKTIKTIDLDDWHPSHEHNSYTFTFESTLEQIYPTSRIDYSIFICGSGDGEDEEYYISSTTENKHIISDVILISPQKLVEYEFFYASWIYLQEKIIAGKKLTENETDFYKELDWILAELSCYDIEDSYPCITIDGELYKFEELRLDLP